MICSASLCHWVGSRVTLLILTLRRRFTLGDGSLFSFRSLKLRSSVRSGLQGGDRFS